MIHMLRPNFPMVANLRATRIFYVIATGQIGAFVAWALADMKPAPPVLPLWFRLPGLTDQWSAVEAVAIACIVTSAAAAVLPARRWMRAIHAINVFGLLGIVSIWHGPAPGMTALFACSLVLAVSRISAETPAMNPRNSFAWVQILLVAACGFQCVLQLQWRELDQVYPWVKAAIIAFLAWRIMRSPQRMTNFAFVFFVLQAADQAVYGWSEDALNPAQISLFYWGLISGAFPFIRPYAPGALTASAR